MKYADIIAHGSVQGVGFRYLVKNIARRYDLKGNVENLDDETVRIICEGERDSIERFIEEIRVAKEPIKVDNIQTKYSEPTGKYKKFDIITGEISEELVEGFSTGLVYLGKLDGKLDSIDGNMVKMLTKQGETVNAIQALTSEIRNTFNQHSQRLEDNARTHS